MFFKLTAHVSYSVATEVLLRMVSSDKNINIEFQWLRNSMLGQFLQILQMVSPKHNEAGRSLADGGSAQQGRSS
jgi:hypothetical protein